MQTFALVILVTVILPLPSAYPKRPNHHPVQKESDPSTIIQRLKAERNVAARRALILSLGEFTDQQLSAAQRRDGHAFALVS